MMNIFNKLPGYRKVFVTILAFFVSVMLLLYKMITADQWVEFNKWLLPSFMASNLLSKMIDPTGKQVEKDG